MVLPRLVSRLFLEVARGRVEDDQLHQLGRQRDEVHVARAVDGVDNRCREHEQDAEVDIARDLDAEVVRRLEDGRVVRHGLVVEQLGAHVEEHREAKQAAHARRGVHERVHQDEGDDRAREVEEVHQLRRHQRAARAGHRVQLDRDREGGDAVGGDAGAQHRLEQQQQHARLLEQPLQRERVGVAPEEQRREEQRHDAEQRRRDRPLEELERPARVVAPVDGLRVVGGHVAVRPRLAGAQPAVDDVDPLLVARQQVPDLLALEPLLVGREAREDVARLERAQHEDEARGHLAEQRHRHEPRAQLDARGDLGLGLERGPLLLARHVGAAHERLHVQRRERQRLREREQEGLVVLEDVEVRAVAVLFVAVARLRDVDLLQLERHLAHLGLDGAQQLDQLLHPLAQQLARPLAVRVHVDVPRHEAVPPPPRLRRLVLRPLLVVRERLVGVAQVLRARPAARLPPVQAARARHPSRLDLPIRTRALNQALLHPEPVQLW